MPADISFGPYAERLFRFSKPQWLQSTHMRVSGVYLAGALFSLGFFVFIDAVAYSRSSKNGSDMHVTFVDWIPGICSALGMFIINSIDRSQLSRDRLAYSSSGVAWKARVVLFIGFALLAGGLAGSASVLVLKYPTSTYSFPTLWFGIANVVGNVLIMLSAVILRTVQTMEEEYPYNLAL